jgi:hypothetical protein
VVPIGRPGIFSLVPTLHTSQTQQQSTILAGAYGCATISFSLPGNSLYCRLFRAIDLREKHAAALIVSRK